MSTGRKLTLRLLVVLVAAAVSIGLWAAGASVSADKAGVLWQLGLGLFTALLTAQTIVFAVSADPETVWPSFLDLVEETGLVLWLTAGTFSVLQGSRIHPKFRWFRQVPPGWWRWSGSWRRRRRQCRGRVWPAARRCRLCGLPRSPARAETR